MPTGRCFDDALEFVESRVIENPALAHEATLTLVHGIALAPSGPHEGEPFAHAWVEEGETVWGAGLLDGRRIYFPVERAGFYECLRIRSATRYTIREAAEENFRTNNYGPWKPEYIALCGAAQIMGQVDLHD
jgi:hypothetical protein